MVIGATRIAFLIALLFGALACGLAVVSRTSHLELTLSSFAMTTSICLSINCLLAAFGLLLSGTESPCRRDISVAMLLLLAASVGSLLIHWIVATRGGTIVHWILCWLALESLFGFGDLALLRKSRPRDGQN